MGGEGERSAADVGSAAASSAELVVLTPRRRLLIVEDDADLVSAYELLLAHPRVEFAFASNGAEAVRKARKVKPDAMLLDVLLPVLDGFSVFRIVRGDRALRTTRAIFLTACADPGSLARARDQGAFACFTKPFAPEALSDAVFSALGLEVPRARGPRRTCPVSARAPSVALVDPDPAFADEVSRALRDSFGDGASLRRLGSGIDAVEDLRGAAPDVVLLSLVLPDVHGLNLLRLIRRDPELSRRPVIVVAGRAAPRALGAALAAGAVACLAKPVAPSLLRSVLVRACVGWNLPRLDGGDPGAPDPRAA